MNRGLSEALKTSQQISIDNFGRKISFFSPSFAHYSNIDLKGERHPFPSISITGARCFLQCGHCNGKLLKTMISAETPSRLIEIGRKIKSQGAEGCLISGGCLPDGTVPLQKFLPVIKMLKDELNLKVVLHTGLIDKRITVDLKESNVDVVSMDIIGSNETIKEIYRLQAGIEQYESSLRLLTDAGIKVTPHILIGLHYGKLKGEFDAIDMVSKYEPSSLIFIVFTPFKETVMENVKPPHPMEIAKVFSYARMCLPSTFQSLGCVRPLHQHRVETDLLAIRSGINGIVFPTRED